MNETKMRTAEAGKLKSKDFITLGIFTVLFFVVTMICIFASAVVVVTYVFAPAIAAIPGGIVYMFMRTKIPKAGGILISGTAISLLNFLTGAGWPVALGILIGTILAELVSRIGKYKSFWGNAIGYAIYMGCFAVGTYLPMLIMTDYIEKLTASNSIDKAFINSLLSYINGPMLVIVVIVTIICAIIGSLLAKAMLKKHFVKAGIV